MGIMTHLVEAIRIMDEKGRRAYDHNSYMLWEKEWEALRLEMMEAIFIAAESSNKALEPTEDARQVS